MNVLDQARAIAANTAMRTQARELRSLRIRHAIAEQRLAIATLVPPEMRGITLAAVIYLVLSLGCEYYAKRKKEQHGS